MPIAAAPARTSAAISSARKNNRLFMTRAPSESSVASDRELIVKSASRSGRGVFTLSPQLRLTLGSLEALHGRVVAGHSIRRAVVSQEPGDRGGGDPFTRAGRRREYDDLHVDEHPVPESIAGRAAVRTGGGFHPRRQQPDAIRQSAAAVASEPHRPPRTERRPHGPGGLLEPVAAEPVDRRPARARLRSARDRQLLR